jgi:hypothetical protein
MQYFNTDFLVRVEVNDFCKSNRYYYLPFKKKTFWSKEQKEGIYDAHDVGNRYIGSVEQFLVENKKYSFNDDSKIIYVKPNVCFDYIDKTRNIYYFETLEEAEEFAAKFTVNEKWIR